MVPDDFGIPLTSINIEATLAANSEKAAEYERREPADAALVARIVKDAMKNDRPLACRQSPRKTTPTNTRTNGE